MMFCNNCGQVIDDDIGICMHCNKVSNNIEYIKDIPSNLVGLSAFCFPLVGMVLYFMWKDNRPKSTSLVLKWTIAGAIFWLVLYIISFGLGILISVYN